MSKITTLLAAAALLAAVAPASATDYGHEVGYGQAIATATRSTALRMAISRSSTATPNCWWKRVRVWDEYYGRHVWKRVRVCR